MIVIGCIVILFLCSLGWKTEQLPYCPHCNNIRVIDGYIVDVCQGHNETK